MEIWADFLDRSPAPSPHAVFAKLDSLGAEMGRDPDTVLFDPIRRPQVLSDDLKPNELIDALVMLRFQGDRPALVAMDRHVRDYLVTALTARRASKA